MSQIMRLIEDTPYEKQKADLIRDFESFLSLHHHGPLQTSSRLACATPQDVTKFLVQRGRNGRTQVHEDGCQFLGLHGVQACPCPKRLASGTIDSMIGKLRAFFNRTGRSDPWRLGNPCANPCDAPDVKLFLRGSQKEQRLAHVTPRQSPPIFCGIVRQISEFILGRIAASPSAPFHKLFSLFRDRAFFLSIWWVGDRAGDLGKAKGVEVTRLRCGSLLMNHTVGKTVRQQDGSLLCLPSVPEEPSMDPVSALIAYVDLCKQNSCDVVHGFLFRPTFGGDHRIIRNRPFTSQAANERLAFYCKSLGLPSDLRVHGHRAGCALTLRLLGVSKEEVMGHCRWSSERVFEHYTKVDRINRIKGSVLALKSSFVRDGAGTCKADAATAFYASMDAGEGFSRAFDL